MVDDRISTERRSTAVRRDIQQRLHDQLLYPCPVLLSMRGVSLSTANPLDHAPEHSITQSHTRPPDVSTPSTAPSQSASGKRVPSGTTRWWDGPRPQTRARHPRDQTRHVHSDGRYNAQETGLRDNTRRFLKAQRQIQRLHSQCELAVRLLFCGNLTRMRPVRLRLDEVVAGETV